MSENRIETTLFAGLLDSELKYLYEQILMQREEGLRPRCLDVYIEKVRKVYPLTCGEAWSYTERLFFEELARRYFGQTESKWNYSPLEDVVVCSSCGYEHYFGTYHQYATQYCPHCGRKMKPIVA